MSNTVQYKTAEVDSLKIFYREAGSSSLPTILLLHGHASSSHTFRNIIPELSKTFHVVAPDYPGFGNSAHPEMKDFSYTFVNIADTIDKFTQRIGLTKFYLYIFDYGAPVGFMIALKHPERVSGFFTQSGNAYVEGLAPGTQMLQDMWADPTNQAKADKCLEMFTPEGIRWAYTHGVPAPEHVAPDAPALDTYYCSRPGAVDIQMALLKDYANVVKLYPQWQAYLREHKPKIVGLWGKNDGFFCPPGAEAFKRDVPDADISYLDAGHFVNESHPHEVIKAVEKLVE